jgi:2-aminoadipate transaminase
VTERTINLTRGVPPPEVFPTEDLIRCAEAALRADGSVLLQYGRSPGYAPLREWVGSQYGAGPEQVLIGNGSLEIFGFIAQRLLRPGARAFVEQPSYDRAITLLRRAGAEVVGIPVEADGVDLAALEAELQRGAPTVLYVIADFQNPLGITTSLAKRRRLVELAERHGFWLLEDGPYRALRYWGEEVPTLRSLNPQRVLHLASFSKTLAPGLRLGYVVGPADMIAELAAWAVNTYIGPVYPTQGMVNIYCRQGLLEPNIERLKTVYRPRLEATLAALDRYLPDGIWSRPEGGFFVAGFLPERFAPMPELVSQAAAAGLTLTDGRDFFPNPADGVRFLRIPFCSLTPEEIETAIARLASLA